MSKAPYLSLVRSGQRSKQEPRAATFMDDSAAIFYEARRAVKGRINHGQRPELRRLPSGQAISSCAIPLTPVCATALLLHLENLVRNGYMEAESARSIAVLLRLETKAAAAAERRA